MQIIGKNNARGASNGASNTINITKTYTIGFSEVQPLEFGGVNQGIDEHCYIVLSQIQSAPITSNNYNMSSTPQVTSSSVYKTNNNLRFDLTNGAYYMPSRSINFYNENLCGIVITKFIDDNNNVKYGFQGTYVSSPSQISYAMDIRVYCKPCVQTGTITGRRITGNLKVLAWNTQTNEYETIEATDIISSSNTNTSYAYNYGGYVGIRLAHYYILCGILEANAHYEDTNGVSSDMRWLTDEDFEEE